MRTVRIHDPIEYFSLNIYFLRRLRIWFYTDLSDNDSISIGQLAIGLSITFFFVFVPIMAEIVHLIKLWKLQALVGTVNLLLIEAQILFKMADLFLRRRSLDRLFEQLRSPAFAATRAQHQRIIRKNIDWAHFMFKALLYSAVADVTAHVVLVPAIHKFRSLPMAMDFIFFDTNATPYFTLVYIYQILYKAIVITTFTAIETMPWVAMRTAIAQLDILEYNLDNIRDHVGSKDLMSYDNNEKCNRYINEIVMHHQAIIKYVKCLEETFSGQLGVTFLLAGIITCNNAIQIIAIQAPFKNWLIVMWMLIFFMNVLFGLFVACWQANILTEKSERVGNIAVYGCPWPHMRPSVRKSLLIMMSRAQSPLTVKSVKIIPVSLATFTLIINWTYKSFAVLNQMKS